MVWSFIWRLRIYYRRVLLLAIVGSACGIVMNTAAVLPPVMLGRAIDAALALEQQTGTVEAVSQAALLFILATVATEGPRIGKRWGLRSAVARVLSEVRLDAMTNVLRHWPMARLNRTPVGDLLARIIGDVEVVGVGVRELTVETWDTLLLEASLFAAMLSLDWRLTLLVALPVPLGLYLGQRVGAAVGERTLASRRANSALTVALQETMTGLRLLRLFGREEAVARRIARLSDDLARTNLAVTWLRGGMAPIYGFVMTSGVVALFVLGGQQVVAGSLTVGAFVAYLELYLRFVGRTPRIPQMLNSLQSSAAAFDRLDPLLPANPPRPPKATWRQTMWQTYVEGPGEPVEGGRPAASAAEVNRASKVELEAVCFRYPGSPECALTNVSLRVAPGGLVAVTGPVGSGKSALARALLGLYPLESGRIVFDGRDAGSYSPAERAQRIAYLPQDGFVFSGTIEENVAFGAVGLGHDAPAGRLEAALHAAAMEEDVQAMPQGVATTVGERGLRISGGQRQRLGLARALVWEAPVLLLDEATSSIDAATEAAIRQALRAVSHERAVITVAHRLATARDADRVLVLAGGTVVEEGTPDGLLEAGGRFAAMVQLEQAGWHWDTWADVGFPALSLARESICGKD